MTKLSVRNCKKIFRHDFFSSLNFPSIPVVILEEFLGKGLESSEGCFGKIHSAVSGKRGSETEKDKGLHEERSSRR